MQPNTRAPRRLRRRATLGAALLAACARETPLAGIVAVPERSLTYAPLILALKQGLYQSPAVRVALSQRADGPAVAAAIASREVVVGAMPLADAVDAVEAGAPLAVIGALTRRFGGQLVVAPSRFPNEGLKRTTDPFFSLFTGGWRGVPVGLQLGSRGTEAYVRAIFHGAGGVASAASVADRSTALANPPYVPRDPLDGEPRWIGYETDEALVAAIRDGRIEAFVGHSLATAEATSLGVNQVFANFSEMALADGSEAAHCTVLVAHQQAIDRPRPLLAQIVAACARASAELTGQGGPQAAQRALPDRDALHLTLAIQFDAPDAQRTVYALDGAVPPTALPTLTHLRTTAGKPATLDLSRSIRTLS